MITEPDAAAQILAAMQKALKEEAARVLGLIGRLQDVDGIRHVDWDKD